MTSIEAWIDNVNNDIGGCRTLVTRLVNKIHGIRSYAMHRQALSPLPRCKGTVLYGKPGTGKTALSVAIAKHSQLPYYLINGPDVFQTEEGASEIQVKKVFMKALEHKFSIIIIDELDMIAGNLKAQKGALDMRIASTLLSMIDRVNQTEDDHFVFIMGLTNRLHAVDPCFLRSGRLDNLEEIKITSPSQRRDILTILTRRLPFVSTVERNQVLDRMASVTHGFVPSDLQSLCAQMILILVKEQHQNDSIETHHIHWHHVEAVLGIVRPSNLNEYASKVPDVRFSDIYGIDDIVETIQASVIYPFHHPEEYQLMGIHPPRGIILYGPPGVGKTMLCSALASEAGINFMFVESSHIRSKVVGESEKNIAKLFASARANAPCILFIDQIDMLLPKRGSSRTSENTSDRIVTSFLTEMDGLLTKSNRDDQVHIDVLVIAATNRIEVMDPAVLRHGRFDEHIHVPIPNAETRAAIIRGLCAKMPVVMNDEDIAQLVHETYHWSGAEIDNLFREAALASLRENVNNATITMNHIHSVNAPKQRNLT